jgi:hypothetical protein
MEDDKEGDASSHSFATLARTEKTSSLRLRDSGSHHAYFQPLNDPSDPAVIEMVDEAMRAYEYAPASEPKFSVQISIMNSH